MRGLFQIKKQLNDPRYKNLEIKYPMKQDFIDNLEKGYCLTKIEKKSINEIYDNLSKRKKVQDFVRNFYNIR